MWSVIVPAALFVSVPLLFPSILPVNLQFADIHDCADLFFLVHMLQTRMVLEEFINNEINDDSDFRSLIVQTALYVPRIVPLPLCLHR